MKIELRSDHVHISGYVNAVDRVSRPIKDKGGGAYVERIMPGAFKRALEKNSSVRILHNHKREIGNASEDGVKLYEDKIGLFCEADIYDGEVIERARKRELVGWSFGFYPEETQRAETEIEGADYECRVKELSLDEVSIIDKRMLPCYEATSLECRAEKEEADYIDLAPEEEKPCLNFEKERARLNLFKNA